MAARSSSLKSLRFVSPDTLPSDYATIFRRSFFVPQKPVVFPRSTFNNLPAISRWFTINRGDGTARLNYDYLNTHSDCHVPLELTKHNAAPSTATTREEDLEDTFKRFHAPLSLFLDWTRSASPQQQHPDITSDSNDLNTIRLYLAQCQLLDLPAALCDDLPTPSIVTSAGKGDIYDTNIWLGLAPTYTPLHRDPNPNLFVQLAGSKRVRLLAPELGLRTFTRVREKLGKGGGRVHAAYRGEDMMQGPERHLLDQEVWADREEASSETSMEDRGRTDGGDLECDGFEATLNAGDGLFIPLGWWHSIKGVGDGITASVNWWFR